MKEAQEKKPVPIRLSETTIEDVKTAGNYLRGMKDQEVMRLALEIGLKVLAQVNYDVAGIVARFAIEESVASSALHSGESGEHSERAQHELQMRMARSKTGKQSSGTKASA